MTDLRYKDGPKFRPLVKFKEETPTIPKIQRLFQLRTELKKARQEKKMLERYVKRSEKVTAHLENLLYVISKLENKK